MLREEIRDKKFPFNFVMHRPEKWDKKLPLIVLLHGAGERGNGEDELGKVETHGFAKIFTADKNYECVLVSPQCEQNSFWAAKVVYIKEFIDAVKEKYEIDESRVYLCGISMGGFGTWYTAMAYPDDFAAIAPCCGGGMPWNAGVLKMPVWAFCGDSDTVVKPYNTTDMIEAMEKAGYTPKLSVFKGVGHNSWDYTFDEELLDWLLSHKKDEREGKYI